MEACPERECWQIDTERSTLAFNLRHALMREIRGEFRCWGGRVLVDRADPAQMSVRVWVDLSSIDTGSDKRNDYILGTELFDLRWEPALVFDSKQVEMCASGRAIVVGWLALHSYRKEIAVSVDAFQPCAGVLEEPRVVTRARASIDRAGFGLRRRGGIGDWLSDRLVGETIEITAHIEAVGDLRAGFRPANALTTGPLEPSLTAPRSAFGRASAPGRPPLGTSQPAPGVA